MLPRPQLQVQDTGTVEFSRQIRHDQEIARELSSLLLRLERLDEFRQLQGLLVLAGTGRTTRRHRGAVSILKKNKVLGCRYLLLTTLVNIFKLYSHCISSFYNRYLFLTCIVEQHLGAIGNNGRGILL